MLWKVSVATLLPLSALLLAACSPPGEPDRPETPPNVILIVLDTVRADHLGCYGYARETSPAIDEFASGATRYTRSISSAPWTVPAHASMFTGLPPFAHGAHTFAVDTPRVNVAPLPPDRVTLAEALRDEGYQTGAFVSNAGYLAAHWQLDQGFENYHVERVYAEKLNERIFPWLDDARPPFFLFVNYIDAHRPYNTKPRPGLLERPVSRDPRLLDALIQAVMPPGGSVPEKLAQRVIDQYDTAIANLDEQVGRLLGRLRAAGLDENTIIVLTSDHGEYFGEHRLVEHSKDVYQEALRVPLIVRHPGQRAPESVDTLVVSNDLPRLVLARFPEESARRLAQGFPDAAGDHLVIAENYYTRRKDLYHPLWGHRFNRVRRAVFDWPFELIHSSDGKHELYDLERDPGEQTNLFGELPAVAGRLAQALSELDASGPGRRGPDAVPDPLPDELRERLEILGYVEE